MVTFNVDSLDFSDGEAIRTGADDDFSTRYSSSNDRLEIEDLTNATVGHIPRDTGTDLVGGKFAETLSEGEALADNGEVYESIQEAVNNASSFVRVGPGRFNETVNIDTTGLTLEGSGERTEIYGSIDSTQDDVVVRNLSVHLSNTSRAIILEGDSCVVNSVTVEDAESFGISVHSNAKVHNCTTRSTGGPGIELLDLNGIATNNTVVDAELNEVFGASEQGAIAIQEDDCIVANNTVIRGNCEGINAQTNGDDSIIIGNTIKDVGANGIRVNTDNVIIANNRLINPGNNGIATGSNNELDANLIT